MSVPVSEVIRVDDGGSERGGEMDFGENLRQEKSQKKTSTTISVSNDEES